MRKEKLPALLLAIFIPRNQPFFSYSGEISPHRCQVYVRPDNMNGCPFPPLRYWLAAKHITIEYTWLCSYSHYFIISQLSHFYSWTGAGVRSIDIGFSAHPRRYRPGVQHTCGGINNGIDIIIAKTMLLVSSGAI